MRMLQLYCVQELQDVYGIDASGLCRMILHVREEALYKMWDYIRKLCEQQLPAEAWGIYSEHYNRYLDTKFTLQL